MRQFLLELTSKMKCCDSGTRYGYNECDGEVVVVTVVCSRLCSWRLRQYTAM